MFDFDTQFLFGHEEQDLIKKIRIITECYLFATEIESLIVTSRFWYWNAHRRTGNRVRQNRRANAKNTFNHGGGHDLIRWALGDHPT